MTQTATIGHNMPPSDLEILKSKLAENNEKALKRAQALIDAADRVPANIGDQDTSDKITDLEKQITVCIKALGEGHEKEKRPYLELGRIVDGFFKDPISTLEAAKKRVKAIQTKFLVDQTEKERKRRAEIAAKEKAERDAKLAEAAKLEEQGQKSKADAVLERAVQHDDDAAFFEGAAEQRGVTVAASVGEMTGSKTSLRYTWTGEITSRDDLDLEALRPYLKIEDLQKALNAFVKANKGTRQIKGAKIWEKPEATTR